MSLEEKHYDLEIQDLIDGKLDSDLRAKLESHIATCEKCRAEFERLNNIKQILRKKIQPISTPENIRTKILEALENEKSAKIRQRKSWLRSEVFIAAAVVILLLIAGIVYRNTSAPRLPSLVAKDFQRYIAKELALQITSSKPEEIQAFFREAGIPFETRVFDLAMMNYQLRGGKVHQLGGKPSAFFVYEGPNHITMVCQMFPGSAQELPQTSEIRDHNGIRFFIYQENGVSTVFWQEGEIICVLASDTKKEDVIQLAFAKAVKV